MIKKIAGCIARQIAWNRAFRNLAIDELQRATGRREMVRKADRYYSDDITWCMAECMTDCPRKPKYIRDKSIPHSFADFSKNCMAYEPKEDEDDA